MYQLTRLELEHLLECFNAVVANEAFLYEEEIEQAVEILEKLKEKSVK